MRCPFSSYDGGKLGHPFPLLAVAGVRPRHSSFSTRPSTPYHQVLFSSLLSFLSFLLSRSNVFPAMTAKEAGVLLLDVYSPQMFERPPSPDPY